MLEIQIPHLTAYDQPDAAEGALDPLGLYPISDALTVNKLCPGVRERQKHPGFLVPIALGAMVAEEFTDQYSEENGISPIQIYEWYIVQSLVLTHRKSNPDLLTGLPGRDKVSTAIDRFGSINTDNYLKTASVFGFYGVYKLLARKLGILHEDQTDENCSNVIEAWEQDEKANNASFRTFSTLVREAIGYGLKYEKTQRNWPHWTKFTRSINPLQPGPKVSSLIWSLLCSNDEPLRAEYLNFILDEGASILESSEADERLLHSQLIKQASPELKALLITVQNYEQFARLLIDAFNQILYQASHTDRPVKTSELAKLDHVRYAIEQLSLLQHALEDGLDAQGYANRLEVFLPLFEHTASPLDWVEALITHHINNQHTKPPNGKMPFFDRLDNGSILTRPAYRLSANPERSERYVHQYRSMSLYSFAYDLERLS